MNKGIVSFTYKKTDRTLRKAQGTLKDVEVSIKRTGKESFKALSYFDVEAAAFRSFRIENLIAIHTPSFLSQAGFADKIQRTYSPAGETSQYNI